MTYIVVTSAFCSLAVSAYAGTYVENFDDESFDGWEICEGRKPGAEWKIEKGILICRRGILWTSGLLFGEEDWHNYTIECDARMVEPMEEELCLMGFGLRIVATKIGEGRLDVNGVASLVGFRRQEAWFSALIHNESSGESEHNAIDFELNRWYRLKAVVHGNTFQFYIDGRLVVSYTNDRFPTGRLGLFAAACEAQFDNIVITGDDVPDNIDSMTDGDLLAIMYWFEEGWRTHNIDLLFSIYRDDAVFDFPSFPAPMSLEETKAFANGFLLDHPTIYIPEGFHRASSKDGIGFMEHTDISVSDGMPMKNFHICLLDFEGPKAKKFTNYSDWGTDLIQAGIMPPRNLGDLIPSFPLPAPESIGHAPMEASAELLERLNSHDLSGVAKMIRRDADVWFPFIGRPANRSEFIDIHEQLLGGFSDANWENVRRVDMKDGWVFSEVTLRGTNDGEFLRRAATGLPMEVRSGLIEHYDENGLATYVHFHFDTLSVPGQEAPTESVED